MKGVWITVAASIVSAMISAAATVYVYKDGGARSYVDVYVDPKTELTALDGGEVREFGKLSVLLVNYSEKDLSDLEFSLDLRRKDGAPIHVIQEIVSGKGGFKELVEELPVKTAPKDGGIRKKFKVSVANRADSDQHFFSIDYILKEKVSRDDFDLRVESLTKGVEAREYAVEHIPKFVEQNRRMWLTIIVTVLGMLVVSLFVFIPISALLTRPLDRRFRREAVRDMSIAIGKHDRFSGLSDAERATLAGDLIHLQRLAFYESKAPLYRYILGMGRPDRVEYQFDNIYRREN